MESSSLSRSLSRLTITSGPESDKRPNKPISHDHPVREAPEYRFANMTAISVDSAVCTLHLADKLKEAAVVVRDFLRREPNHRVLQYRHACLLKELGAYADARMAYERFRALSVTVPVGVMLDIAECFLHEHDYANAVTTLNEACLNERRGLIIASQALRFLGRPAEAEAYCLHLRTRDGLSSDEEVAEYGLALFQQGRDEEALSCLRGHPEVDQLAVLLCNLGQHEENIKTYNCASVAEHPGLARWLAISHAALRNWPDAELFARVGLDGNPEDQELWSLLQTALAKQNAGAGDAEARMRAHLAHLHASEALEDYLMALAKRAGAAKPSWDFVLAYAAYHGARQALPLYEEHFSGTTDAGYLLHMGERLIDWSVFHVGAPMVSLDTMRDIVDGAALLRAAATKAFLGPRSQVRRARLGDLLQTLDAHGAMLEQFRILTTPVPDDAGCAEHLVAGARISAYYRDYSAMWDCLEAAKDLGANFALLVELGMPDAAPRARHPDEQKVLHVGQALIDAGLPIDAGIIASLYARAWRHSADLQAMAAHAYFAVGDYALARKHFRALKALQGLAFSIQDGGKLAECHVGLGQYQDAYDVLATYPGVLDRRALWMKFIALWELGRGTLANQPSAACGELEAQEHKRIADLLRAHGHVRQADRESQYEPRIKDIIEVSPSDMPPVADSWQVMIARLEADVQSNAAARCYVQKCIPFLQRIPRLPSFLSAYTRAMITRSSYVELDGEITAVNGQEGNGRMVEIALSVAPPTLSLLNAAVWNTSDGAKYGKRIADRHGDFEPLLELHRQSVFSRKEYLETLQMAAQRYPDRYNRALKQATKEQKKDDKEMRKIERALEKSRKKAELQRLRHPLPGNYPEMMTLSDHATTAHNNERFLVYGSGRPG
ncbi:hypothetical protein BDV38DRAFT_276636 [Aspergillus pseudotamarii]|uniref:Uncharacterized protein n=1 Tax=Aspergillus pseudotamarii TaxID=132259 RepID=A0A5N6TBQ3_ASPPS|nr:uncharacterized protein BDV38DRAFT_276636 [Aspergillus pseudotamarii]KAE8143551.1 hypothetical protein BDV38DRAFT_276636 [Aspergillus pseudotamarii]